MHRSVFLGAFVLLTSIGLGIGCGASRSASPFDAPSTADASSDGSPTLDASIDTAPPHVRCDGGPVTFSCSAITPTANELSCAGNKLALGPLPPEALDASYPIGCTAKDHPSGFADDPAIWGDGCSGRDCTCQPWLQSQNDGGAKDDVLVGQWACPL